VKKNDSNSQVCLYCYPFCFHFYHCSISWKWAQSHTIFCLIYTYFFINFNYISLFLLYITEECIHDQDCYLKYLYVFPRVLTCLDGRCVDKQGTFIFLLLPSISFPYHNIVTLILISLILTSRLPCPFVWPIFFFVLFLWSMFFIVQI
jgi:hypothetical protein